MNKQKQQQNYHKYQIEMMIRRAIAKRSNQIQNNDIYHIYAQFLQLAFIYRSVEEQSVHGRKKKRPYQKRTSENEIKTKRHICVVKCSTVFH